MVYRVWGSVGLGFRVWAGGGVFGFGCWISLPEGERGGFEVVVCDPKKCLALRFRCLLFFERRVTCNV